MSGDDKPGEERHGPRQKYKVGGTESHSFSEQVLNVAIIAETKRNKDIT